ncbi:MAG TPA: polyketide synthase dehydratase domain-containing protein, partial [Pseudonocardiaceae bacterium]
MTRAETYEKTFTGTEPLVAQHRSGGVGLLPAAVQMEMAMLGVARRGAFTPLELTGVSFLRPGTVADDGATTVRLDVAPGPEPRFELSVAGGGGRRALSTGTGRLLPAAGPVPAWDVSCPRAVPPAALYTSWAATGLEYGPDFRTVAELSVGDGTARAVLRTGGRPQPWYSHPLLVDGVFQVVSCALQEFGEDGPRPLLPIGFTRFAVLAPLSRLTEVTVRVRRTAAEGAFAVGDALLLGADGTVLAELIGLRMRALPSAAAAAPVRAVPASAGSASGA